MLLSSRSCTPCTRTLEAPRRRRAGQSGEGFHAPLEGADLALEVLVLGGQPAARGAAEVGVVAPPVEADLLRLVDGADDEADPEGEEVDLGQGNADIARDQQSLVEDPIEDVDEAGRGAVLVERKVRSQCGAPREPAGVESAIRTSEKIHQDNVPLKAARKQPARPIIRRLNHERGPSSIGSRRIRVGPAPGCPGAATADIFRPWKETVEEAHRCRRKASPPGSVSNGCPSRTRHRIWTNGSA